MILQRLIRYLVQIYNWQRIPRLPWMLAADYDDVDSPERRVMARVGARDPRGVKQAMRKYGVDNVNDLVALLEHQEAKQQIAERAELMANRLIGGSAQPAHQVAIMEDARRAKRRKNNDDLYQRIYEVQQWGK